VWITLDDKGKEVKKEEEEEN
jgi:hypothetical protein